jgi:hypothetical protein
MLYLETVKSSGNPNLNLLLCGSLLGIVLVGVSVKVSETEAGLGRGCEQFGFYFCFGFALHCDDPGLTC